MYIYCISIVRHYIHGDMHLKDLLGSIVRVWCHIPVPDFYLCCQESTIMDYGIHFWLSSHIRRLFYIGLTGRLCMVKTL